MAKLFNTVYRDKEKLVEHMFILQEYHKKFQSVMSALRDYIPKIADKSPVFQGYINKAVAILPYEIKVKYQTGVTKAIHSNNLSSPEPEKGRQESEKNPGNNEVPKHQKTVIPLQHFAEFDRALFQEPPADSFWHAWGGDIKGVSKPDVLVGLGLAGGASYAVYMGYAALLLSAVTVTTTTLGVALLAAAAVGVVWGLYKLVKYPLSQLAGWSVGKLSGGLQRKRDFLKQQRRRKEGLRLSEVARIELIGKKMRLERENERLKELKLKLKSPDSKEEEEEKKNPSQILGVSQAGLPKRPCPEGQGRKKASTQPQPPPRKKVCTTPATNL